MHGVGKVLLLVNFANDSDRVLVYRVSVYILAFTEIPLSFVLCIYVTPDSAGCNETVTVWGKYRILESAALPRSDSSPGVLARCHPSVRASPNTVSRQSLNRTWSSVTDPFGCCLHPLTQQGTRCIQVPLHPFRAPGSQLYRDSPRANWSSSQHLVPQSANRKHSFEPYLLCVVGSLAITCSHYAFEESPPTLTAAAADSRTTNGPRRACGSGPTGPVPGPGGQC